MLVDVATFYNSHEAHIWRSKLIDNNIPAFVADENFGSLYSFALTQVRLQVPEGFEEQAQKILDE
jgi:hypothetical protein